MPMLPDKMADDLPPATRAYLADLADRMVKSAAQGAILAVGVESTTADAFAIDWRLCAGMAIGSAFLSLLMNLATRGLSGRSEG